MEDELKDHEGSFEGKCLKAVSLEREQLLKAQDLSLVRGAGHGLSLIRSREDHVNRMPGKAAC